MVQLFRLSVTRRVAVCWTWLDKTADIGRAIMSLLGREAALAPPATDGDDSSGYNDDDDTDSLGNALSDYNSIFYDAPSIDFNQLGKLKLVDSDGNGSSGGGEMEAKRGSREEVNIDFDYDGNRTDEDLESESLMMMSSDDDRSSRNSSTNQQLHPHLAAASNVNNSGNRPAVEEQQETVEDGETTHEDHDATRTADGQDEVDEGPEDDDGLDIDKEFENYLNDEDDHDDNNGDGGDQMLQDGESHESVRRRLQMEKNAKLEQLESIDFFESADVDISKLRRLAINKHGFVNKKFRRKAWPLLILNNKVSASTSSLLLLSSSLSLQRTNSISKPPFDQITQAQIKENRYFNQITLDVVRTLKRFPPEISEKLRTKLQNQLIDLICKILIRNDNLHYYQGYHDICLTFLLVSGATECLPLLENITLTHLTCYMETTMESTLKLLFNIMPLIDKISSQVAEHIQRAELGVIFSLSWLITWYSHVMENLKIILRLYDFFIATDPLMPIYLGAIIVADKADEILSIDCDMASLHTVITKFPTNINDFEKLENYINSAVQLFEDYPPDRLMILNEKWQEKCAQIKQEMEEKIRLERELEAKLRRRRIKQQLNKGNKLNLFSGNKKADDDDDDDYDENGAAKRSKMVVRRSNRFFAANRFLVGLTAAVGVAAVTVYAINTNKGEPQELLSKVFHHFLNYRNF